jgi:hypothetical protein
MSGELNSTRDIARYFNLSGINVTPSAATILLRQLLKNKFSDERQRFIERFLATYQEYTVLNAKSVEAARATGTLSGSNLLDDKVCEMILNSKSMTEFDVSAVQMKTSVKINQYGGPVTSFKTLKA